MFQLKVRSYGICPTLPGLFHLPQCSPVPSMLGGSGEGTVRRGYYRNYYKGHMDKIKGEGGGGGREGGLDGVGWRDEEKRHTTVVE